MRPYRILPHTSEIALEVTGRDLGELFKNAGQGLMRLYGLEPRGPAQQELTVRVKSATAESLLVHWMTELVYLIQTRNFLPVKFEFPRVQEADLVARLHGHTFDPARQRLAREVKAVTYHRLKIVRERDHLKSEVVIDV